MMGMGGNVGVQAATIAVQNIATGHANVSGPLRMAFHEMRVGLVMGLGFALVLGAYTMADGRCDRERRARRAWRLPSAPPSW